MLFISGGVFTLANFARDFALSLHVLLNKNYLFSLLNVQASAKSRVKSRQCKRTFNKFFLSLKKSFKKIPFNVYILNFFWVAVFHIIIQKMRSVMFVAFKMTKLLAKMRFSLFWLLQYTQNMILDKRRLSKQRQPMTFVFIKA